MLLFMVKTMKLNKFCLISGKDIQFENTFYIHAPTIEELGEYNISEDDLLKALRVITITKNVLENIPNEKQDINTFFFFLAVLANPNFPEEDKQNIVNVLSLILNRYKLMLNDKGIMLINTLDNKQIFYINENNFEIFQNYLREIFCLEKFFPQEQEYNVKSEKARRIAEQLKHSYISILSIGTNTPLDNLINKTIYQIFYLLDRYTLYYNVDLDIRCRLAGSTNDKEMDNWMKII